MGTNTGRGKGDAKNTLETPLTAAKAVRAYCLGCSGGSANEVRMCELKHCPLYRFRSGKNPNIPKREQTDEQKAATAARMAKARAQKMSG